jgi:hypothetical protein
MNNFEIADSARKWIKTHVRGVGKKNCGEITEAAIPLLMPVAAYMYGGGDYPRGKAIQEITEIIKALKVALETIKFAEKEDQ